MPWWSILTIAHSEGDYKQNPHLLVGEGSVFTAYLLHDALWDSLFREIK